MRARADAADGHATTLSDAAASYQVTDEAQSARLANLLPWADRALRPGT